MGGRGKNNIQALAWIKSRAKKAEARLTVALLS